MRKAIDTYRIIFWLGFRRCEVAYRRLLEDMAKCMDANTQNPIFFRIAYLPFRAADPPIGSACHCRSWLSLTADFSSLQPISRIHFRSRIHSNRTLVMFFGGLNLTWTGTYRRICFPRPENTRSRPEYLVAANFYKHKQTLPAKLEFFNSGGQMDKIIASGSIV